LDITKSDVWGLVLSKKVYPIGKYLHILNEGRLLKNKDGFITHASSSSVLIEDDPTVIVDTSTKDDCCKIVKSLRDLEYTPEDIDIVINTHMHNDHRGCNKVFVNAEKYAHQLQINDGSIKSVDRLNLKNVSIMETPGHVPGHISVVFKNEIDMNIVIAGDAIPTRNNYYKWLPPRISYNSKEAIESMEKIAKIADIIIPGHDRPIVLLK